MARQLEFNKTVALEAAMHTFWSKGYEATSLSELESAMKLTRTSIYNTFGNKQNLFEKVIAHYQKTALGELFQLLENSQTIHEGIKKYLNGVIDFHFNEDTPGGCLIVLSILEREQHQPQTIAMLENAVQMMTKGLKEHIKRARDSGQISKNIDPHIIATTIATTLTGIIVMGKAGFSKSSLRNVANTISTLLLAT